MLKKSQILIGWLMTTLVTPTVIAQQAAPLHVSSQVDGIDSRWLAWIGCWSPVTSRPAIPTTAPSRANDGEVAEQTTLEEGLACVLPTENSSAVELLARLPGHELSRRRLIADGERHEIRDGECLGWQKNQWSANGWRLYTWTELTCGDGATHQTIGMTMIAPGRQWLDAQVVSSGTYRELVVRRFLLVDPERTRRSGLDLQDTQLRRTAEARRSIARPISLGEIAEASALTDPEVIEAAMLESGSKLDLDAAELVRLADAGVSPQVIDLAVALSYPERFIVDRFGEATELEGGSEGGGGDFWGDLGASPYYRYARGNPYAYFAPFGYYYWTPVVTRELSHGRVVRGKGYTRVRSREPSESQKARRRGSSYRGDASSRGSSSSSGGSVGSSGYRSGGGSSGRTAKPRNPPPRQR